MKMQTVNLFPPEIMIRRRQAIMVRRAVAGAAVVAVLAVGFLGIQRIRLSSLRAEQEHMRETMAANQEMVARIAAVKAKQKALEARAAILLNAVDSPRWGKILFELSSIVPDDVWIQSLAFAPQDKKLAVLKASQARLPGSNSSGNLSGLSGAVLHDYGEIKIQGGGAGAQSVSRFIEEMSKSSHFDNVTPIVTETLGMGRPASYTLVGRLLF